MRELLARLRDWLRRDKLDRELVEELRFHQRQLEQDATANGVSAFDSAHAARRQLGNVTVTLENARERWSIPSIDNFFQDVRYAVRGLRRNAGFTITAVLTLALGIGANAAMFNVVDRMMFRPLTGLKRPNAVHRVYWQSLNHGTLNTTTSTEYTRYLDLNEWTTSFDALVAISERDLAVGDGEASRERRVGIVSASYFDLFDARPAVGRFFTASEDQTPQGADVAVLSYAFWQTEFGGRNVLGTLLQVGNTRATVIGVAPKGFDGVNDANPPAVFIPVTTFAASTGTNDSKTYFSRYQWSWINVLARRKPSVSIAAANTDATNAYRRSWQKASHDEPGYASIETAAPQAIVAAVRPGGGPAPSLEARTALWTGIVATIVLLIAVANVANLSLVRAIRRQRETVVRLALGVSRGRLMFQSMTESMVLALLAGTAALIVSQWSAFALQQLLVANVSATSSSLGIDWRMTIAVLVLTFFSGLIIGLAPSLLSPRGDLAGRLRGGARGGTSEGGRLRSSLLVTQAALSVVLLIGAALFVRSLNGVQQMRMGYDADRVLLVNRVNRGAQVEEATQLAMRNVMMASAQALPVVESAAWLVSAPFVSSSSANLFVPGIDSVARLGVFRLQATTGGYFRTLGTRILRGRALNDGDRMGAPNVAVISESMARVLWPGQNVIGKCFRIRADTMPCNVVVGVAEDMVQSEIGGGTRYQFYVSIDQYTRSWGNWMAVRVKGDPATLAEGIRQSVQRDMPAGAYVTVLPLASVVHNEQRSWRLGAGTFGAFGILALLVAAVGLYGVMGYNVAERMHELSVRVALGARTVDVLRLVVGQGVRLVLVGSILGMALAAVASHWLQPLLFDQSAKDPTVYAGVAIVMVLVALAASAVPATRATAANPNAALRAE
ncbi:MAG: ADOP family duplicated permease [Gemmatimonas sp.]